jgi:hypothetical protein
LEGVSYHDGTVRVASKLRREMVVSHDQPWSIKSTVHELRNDKHRRSMKVGSILKIDSAEEWPVPFLYTVIHRNLLS